MTTCRTSSHPSIKFSTNLRKDRLRFINWPKAYALMPRRKSRKSKNIAMALKSRWPLFSQRVIHNLRSNQLTCPKCTQMSLRTIQQISDGLSKITLSSKNRRIYLNSKQSDTEDTTMVNLQQSSSYLSRESLLQNLSGQLATWQIGSLLNLLDKKWQRYLAELKKILAISLNWVSATKMGLSRYGTTATRVQTSCKKNANWWRIISSLESKAVLLLRFASLDSLPQNSERLSIYWFTQTTLNQSTDNWLPMRPLMERIYTKSDIEVL